MPSAKVDNYHLGTHKSEAEFVIEPQPFNPAHHAGTTPVPSFLAAIANKNSSLYNILIT